MTTTIPHPDTWPPFAQDALVQIRVRALGGKYYTLTRPRDAQEKITFWDAVRYLQKVGLVTNDEQIYRPTPLVDQLIDLGWLE